MKKFKALTAIILAVTLCLFSMTCYANVLSYPELPCAGDGYDNYVVIYSPNEATYRCLICKYTSSDYTPYYSSTDDMLFFGQAYNNEESTYMRYNLVDDQWVYVKDASRLNNFNANGNYIVMSTADVINYETGTVFFRQTESHQVLKVTTTLIKETLRTMTVGLIPLLLPLLIGSAGLWIAWRWLLKNLRQE